MKIDSKTNGLVSIIMPTYNRAHYILETIKSIQSQTYTNWELYVMDDGSTDNTKELVLAIEDDRIRYCNEGRIGITGVLKNKAIRESKGELITFMDSDDLLAPHKLEAQVNALQQNPDAGFSFTNCHDFNEQGIQRIYLDKQQGIEVGNFFEAICWGHKLVFIQTVMFRRTCIDALSYFRENRIFTDFSFITNLAWKHKAIILYESLFFRRLHSGNNINSNWVLDYDEYIETIERYRVEKRLTKQTANKILFIGIINCGLGYIKHGNKVKAVRSFMKAWKYKPLSIIPLKKIIKTFVGTSV
ncbi:MAG: glycosyltransferase family 2 protein [Flavipsychrobacter sp.]|nr:glycosyltransferase family 2 protein [Flavipsychrobacter sp.]